MPLILSRKPGEEIVLGAEEIIITFVEMLRGKARISVEAPPHVTIHRREVYDVCNRDGTYSPRIFKLKGSEEEIEYYI